MRLRFTIRDLLWLTALVAVAAGWAVDHWTHSAGYREQILQATLEVMSQKLVEQDRERQYRPEPIDRMPILPPERSR
jgi:hypothetical protein